MYYLRRIANIIEWTRLTSEDTSDVNPNFNLTQEFLDQELSVWKVRDEAEALRLSAAICFTRSDGAIRCVLAYVEEKTFEATHLNFNKTPGKTLIREFDDKHFEVAVKDLKSLDYVIKLFLSGDVFDFSKSEIEDAMKGLFQAGCYDYRTIAQTKEVKTPGARGLLKVIAAGLVDIVVPGTVDSSRVSS